MDFYDAHIHYFFKGPANKLFQEFQDNPNFLGGCLLMFEEVPASLDEALQMVPAAYHHVLTEEAIYTDKDAISLINNYSKPAFIPYVDTRYFNNENVNSFEVYMEKGYRCVKILYIPELDENIGIQGWEKSMGRSVSASEQITADIISKCSRLNLPVLFHVDLRRYGDFVFDLLSGYEDLYINIPHFGSSRREMTRFLERYENCYTDMSSLLPFIKDSPDAYMNFFKAFPDRILFGTDAIFGLPDMVWEYTKYINGCLK